MSLAIRSQIIAMLINCTIIVGNYTIARLRARPGDRSSQENFKKSNFCSKEGDIYDMVMKCDTKVSSLIRRVDD